MKKILLFVSMALVSLALTAVYVVTISVPEPATMLLLGMGLLGLATGCSVREKN